MRFTGRHRSNGTLGSNRDDDVEQSRARLARRKCRLRETVGWKLISLITAEGKVRSSQIVDESDDRDLGRDVVSIDHDRQLQGGHHATDGLIASVPPDADEDIAATGKEQNQGQPAGQAESFHDSALANFTPKSEGSGSLAPFGNSKKLFAGENCLGVEVELQFVEECDWFCSYKKFGSGRVGG